ncbi:hypothetical protein, partial [Raoultella sp. 18117]|uniref:hypothetical protein n=1 Tax=Raoultella sp. 18117 TaxID=2681449 RepID=UPI001D0F7B58
SVSALLRRTNSPGADLHSTQCCPEGGGQEARHKLSGIKQTKKSHAQAWGFLLSAVQEKRPDAARIGRCAPRSLTVRVLKNSRIRSNRPQDARHKLPYINQAVG